MIRRIRNAFSASVSNEEVDALVEAGMTNLLTALENVIDDEGVLAHIHAQVGKGKPAAGQETGNSDGDAADAVCARIRMLETAIAEVVKAKTAPSLLGVQHLAAARRYLFELRNGLQGRKIPEHDASRLLSNAWHALHEADMILRRQHGMPLQQSVLTQIEDIQQLNSDLLSQLEVITEKVLMLFGHSGDSAPVLVPQR